MERLCGNSELGLSCSRLLLYTERILLCSNGQRHSQVTLVNATGRWVGGVRRDLLRDFMGRREVCWEYQQSCWQASQSTEQVRVNSLT